jgi:hypothetical protein
MIGVAIEEKTMEKLMVFVGVLIFYLGFVWVMVKIHKKYFSGLDYSQLSSEERARRLAEYDRFQTLRALDRIEMNTRRDDWSKRY